MTQVQLRSSRLTLANTPNAVGLARLHAADVLSAWGVRGEVLETVLLLLSELATNAVRHSEEGEQAVSLFSEANPVHTFEVILELAKGVLRLSVWDRDGRPPVLKRVGVDAVGGRGIFIVAAMSSRWGHYLPQGGVGKVVWAEVLLDQKLEEASSAHGRPSTPETDERGEPRVSATVIGRVLVGVRGL